MLPAKSVLELVHARAEAMHVDLSLEELSFLVSLFFLGLAGNGTAGTDLWLVNMADECAAVRNETHASPH